MEGKEKEKYEKKRKLKKALEEGKPIPTELRKIEPELQKEIDLEDENTKSIEFFSSKELLTQLIFFQRTKKYNG